MVENVTQLLGCAPVKDCFLAIGAKSLVSILFTYYIRMFLF